MSHSGANCGNLPLNACCMAKAALAVVQVLMKDKLYVDSRYVMSDCAGLPFRVAERFGDKVLLPSLDARVEHIDHFTNNRTNDILVLRSTFAEHYLFSMTDFQVNYCHCLCQGHCVTLSIALLASCLHPLCLYCTYDNRGKMNLRFW